MPDDRDNQTERREAAGGIGRRSDIARLGMNAANYVRGLSARQETLSSKIDDITEYIIFHSNLDEDE